MVIVLGDGQRSVSLRRPSSGRERGGYGQERGLVMVEGRRSSRAALAAGVSRTDR